MRKILCCQDTSENSGKEVEEGEHTNVKESSREDENLDMEAEVTECVESTNIAKLKKILKKRQRNQTATTRSETGKGLGKKM